MADKYDVLILGGGNAGMGVTVPTRAAGLSVAMVEADLLGGTCPIAAARRKRCWWPRAMPCTRSSGRRSTGSRSASRHWIGLR